MTKIISIINHKGGTGKTTSALNIGASLAKFGNKTLLIDIDPQANLTEGLGVYDTPISIYDSIRKNAPLPILNITENLDLVPSSLDLVGVEMELVSAHARELVIKKLLAQIDKVYDFIIFDCPPTLGLLTINALVPSHSVLIPLEAEYYAYRGLDRIVGIINDVKEHYNPDLYIEGVFITKFKSNLKLSQAIRQSINDLFGEKLLDTFIRVNISLAEAQAKGVDVFRYDEQSNGAKDYEKLVLELLK